MPEGLGKSVWSVDTLLLMVPSEWPREPSLVPRFWKGQPKMLAGTWKLVDLGVHVYLKSVECPLEEQGWVGPEAQGQGTGPKGGGPIWLLWKESKVGASWQMGVYFSGKGCSRSGGGQGRETPSSFWSRVFRSSRKRVGVRMCEEPGREGGAVRVALAPDPSTQRVVQKHPGSQDSGVSPPGKGRVHSQGTQFLGSQALTLLT